MACCGGFNHEDSQVADSNLVLLTDSVTKSDHLASEMAVQVESGIVLEHVRNVYNLVRHETQNMGGSVDSDLLDKAYCSKSWNELLMAVRKKEFETSNTFFEVNHWTMAYDTNQVSFDEFEVKYCYIGANVLPASTSPYIPPIPICLHVLIWCMRMEHGRSTISII